MTEQEYTDATNKACLTSVIQALDTVICLEGNPEFTEARRLLWKVRDEIKIDLSPE